MISVSMLPARLCFKGRMIGIAPATAASNWISQPLLPPIDEAGLIRLLSGEFPTLERKYRQQFAALFLDLQKKCESAEVSSKALDLRGLLDALRLIQKGVAPGMALDMGITNKAFDAYEQGLIRDVITARIPAKLGRAKFFTD